MTINYKGDAVRAISTLGLGGVDITKWPILAQEVSSIKSNIGYNTTLAAGIFALGQLNLVDGVVNPFSTETYIDLPASSNQVYDSAGDFYKNGVGAGADSWTKTANSNSTGFVNFSIRNILKGANITTSGAYVRLTLNAALAGGGMKIDNVSIGERSGVAATVNAPVEVLFSGASGTGIVPVNTTIVSDWLLFSVDETKDYVVILDISSDAANDDIGLVAGNAGDGYYERSGFNGYNIASDSGYTLGVADRNLGLVKMEVAPADANITVQSTAITANAVPTEAHLSFLITPVSAITPDTDISGYVSRDGGTTFTQATLTAQGVGFPWQSMLSGGVDLSGQPSGSSMKWKLVSANNKVFNFENVSLFWN